MNKNKAIIINGKQYDSESGLLIGSISQQRVAETRSRIRTGQAKHSYAMHSRVQRSQTLRRRSVSASQAKPAPVVVAAPAQNRLKNRQHIMAQTPRSPMVTRFADVTAPPKSIAKPVVAPITAPVKPAPAVVAPAKPAPVAEAADTPFQAHPVAAKAAERLASAKAESKPSIHEQPASVVKQAMINEAMSRTPSSKDNQRASRSRRKKETKKSFRFMSFAGASLAVVMLGGYFSYLAMPNLSVRVAAIQSGVDATYPGFKPNGYSLNGPVAYTGGQVSMDFKANGGPQTYTLTQTNSSWDSSAVEENYVKSDVGDDYSVTQKQGLTIYTYSNGKAAWVNKGIFYSLQGNAPLSTDQIARIATSM